MSDIVEVTIENARDLMNVLLQIDFFIEKYKVPKGFIETRDLLHQLVQRRNKAWLLINEKEILYNVREQDPLIQVFLRNEITHIDQEYKELVELEKKLDQIIESHVTFLTEYIREYFK